MPKGADNLLNYIRTVTGVWRDDPHSDAELLARFAETRDEMAFATLLGRYGTLVWQTCRRLLNSTSDAEDAFQTVFLVLAKTSDLSSIRNLAGWLHRVARRTALDIQSGIRRKHKLEQELRGIDQPQVERNASREGLYSAVDEELANLSERLRLPMLLHYLEGKSQDEVAKILGCSRRTIRERLEKGEATLRQRLERRGLTLGIGLMAALLTATAKAPSMPACLISSTARAAVAFRANSLTGGAAEGAQKLLRALATEGAVRKLWWAVTVCIGTFGLGGVGVVAWKMFGDGSNAVTPEAPKPVVELSNVRSQTDIKPNDKQVDCFGDPLPKGALARIGTVRFRPSAGIWSDRSQVAFGPEGKTIFSSHDDNVIYVWETTTGKELFHFEGPKNGYDLQLIFAVSPTGKQFVALPRHGGELWSWDLSDNLPRLRWKNSKTGNSTDVPLAFSPDGKLLACGGQSLYLLDAATGKEFRKLNLDDKKDCCTSLVFSPDGKTLASCQGRNSHEGNSVCLWDVTAGVKLHTLKCDAVVKSFAFSPDNLTLAVATLLDVYQLWDVNKGVIRGEKVIRQSKLRETDSILVAYLADGKTLLTTENEQIRFLDPVTGKDRRAALDCHKLLGHSVISSDGRWLASVRRKNVYEQSINVFDLTTGQQVGPTDMPDSCLAGVAFSLDGKTVATYMCPGIVQLWDAATGKPQRRLNRNFLEHNGCNWNGLRYADNGQLYTLRTNNGQKYPKLKGGTLIGWDTRTGTSLLLPRDIPIEACWAVTHDGRLAAVRENKSDIVLYELETGKKLRRINGPYWPGQDKSIEFGFDSLTFSDDGRTLVAHAIYLPPRVGLSQTFQHNALMAWDVATGRPRFGGKTIESTKPPYAEPQLIALSPDGRWIATRHSIETPDPDKEIEAVQLWEVASGTAGPCLPIKGLTDDVAHPIVECLTFSPDGRTIAYGSSRGGKSEEVNGIVNILHTDPKVGLLDIASGQELQRFTGHRDHVTAVNFAPDGSRLVSACHDSTALVWDLRHLPHPLVTEQIRTTPEALWSDMIDADATKAYRAIDRLSKSPDEALPLLRQRLRPKPSADLDPKQVARWIADLDDSSFEVRQQASTELKKCGAVLPDALIRTLEHALEQRPSPEVHHRLQELLTPLYMPSLTSLSAVRGVEVLERIGTVEARQLLGEWAHSGENRQAEEAQAALERLAKRKLALKP